MQAWRRGSVFSYAVIVVLFALLPLLAMLQYRWIGQISETEREHMQAGLRRLAGSLNDDVNREMARVYAALQSEPTADFEPPEYASRYARLQASIPYPSLIEDLYLVDARRPSEPELLRFHAASQSFERSDWPPAFLAMKERLEERRQGFMRPGGRGGIFGMADQLGPAVFVPLMYVVREPDAPQFPRLNGFAIALLNWQYLSSDWIGEMVKRHFPQGQEYEAAIVDNRDPAKVIYQSDPNLSPDFFRTPDLSAGLLDLRGEYLMRAAPEMARGRGFFGMRRSFGGQPGPGGPPEGGPPRRSFSPPPPPPLPESGGPSFLRLLVKHRAGSLDAAVAAARNRNMAVSFAILLLMAGSIAMLILSTHRAQRLARLQIEFVAGVSHELRTPLAVICSAGDNLADGLVTAGQQVQRYGALIRTEGQRLSEMVDQILGYTALQSGKQKYELQPVSMHDIIQRALAACSADAARAGCRIETDADESLPQVMGDAPALGRCLQNLLTNAIKYAAEGGWIGVRAVANGNELQVTVEDRGPGVPAADLPHVFEPFYRGGKVMAAQIHGAGLGLSLVDRIVKGHGGRVAVESKPGEGARFILYVPLAPAPPEPELESVADA